MSVRPDLDHSWSIRFYAIGAFAAAFVSTAANSQSQSWDWCEGKGNPTFDQRLSACTAIIDSGNEPQHNVAKAFADRGVAYVNNGDKARAIRDFEDSLRLDSTSSSSHRVRGNKYSAEGDNERAIAEFSEAIRLDSSDARAFGNRGRAYIAKKDYARAIVDFNEAIRLDPQLGSFFGGRGSAHLTQGNISEAIADFSEAIKLAPAQAVAFRARARAYYANKDYDRAIADFSEAIQLNSKDAPTLIGRALAYRAKGDNSLAISDYDQAIQLDSKSVTAFHNRGNVHFALKNYDHAIVDYGEAIRLDPKSASVFLMRGRAYSQKGDHLSAIADFDQTLQLNPEIALAYGNRCGARIAARHDLRAALSDCEESLRLQPSQILAYINRGFVRLKLGSVAQAMFDFDVVLAKDPKEAWSLYGRGLAKWKKGDVSGAEADITAASKNRSGIALAIAKYYDLAAEPDLAYRLSNIRQRENPLIFVITRGDVDACGPGCNEWIAADGAFDSGAEKRLRNFLGTLNGRKLPIFFNSTGGSMRQSFGIGRILRERKMTASVGVTVPEECDDNAPKVSCRQIMQSNRPFKARLRTDGAVCHSACVYALMGASVRQIPVGARLGVHASVRPSSPAGQTRQSKAQIDAYLHAVKRRYAIQMGIGPELVDMADKVPYVNLHILSRDEIVRFKIKSPPR